MKSGFISAVFVLCAVLHPYDENRNYSRSSSCRSSSYDYNNDDNDYGNDINDDNYNSDNSESSNDMIKEEVMMIMLSIICL